MITPRFSCSQTPESVVVSIYCPSVRSSEVEINVDETLFTVHVNPYFLRLNFSHPLLEEDHDSSAKYDAGSGYLLVTLMKQSKGQHFKDLDLLAKLLAPRPTSDALHGPTIEVLGSVDAPQDQEPDLVRATEALSLEHRELLEAAKNDWQLPQIVPDPALPLQTSARQSYGFLGMYSGYFRHVSHTENEVNELGLSVETCPVVERRQRRLEHEDEKWDEEHYMADYVDDGNIQELLTWTHPHVAEDRDFEYTEEENLTLLRLPRKEYLASGTQTHDLYLTLLTLLFSYAYESRTTQRDSTPESAWTISALTSAFSALDPPPYLPAGPAADNAAEFSDSELVATMIPSYRRSVAFPLYRSFAMADICLQDVAKLISKGKRTVLRCLLEMKDILDHHEVYYVYSKIWVDDFCVWMQAHGSEEVLHELGVKLAAVKMKKALIGWELEELEAATRHAENREADSDDESVEYHCTTFMMH